MLRLISILGLALVLCTSCKEAKPAFEGTISGAGNIQVMLEQQFYDASRQAIAKEKTDANGHFKIERDEPLPEGIYLLTVGAKRVYLATNGKEKSISIAGDLATIDKYNLEVEGSETMKCHADILEGVIAKQTALSPDDVRKAIKDACNPLVSSMLAQMLAGQQPQAFLPEIKEAATSLNTYAAGSKYALDFDKWVKSVEKSSMQQQATEMIQVGQPAPEIALSDPNGKVRTLSSLKGQVVLLDFWASWCGPCRRANPHVVDVYKRYKNKGFTVFSVSLDNPNGKEKWVAAIKQDNLIWDNHVSDLMGWNSAPAALYGVTGIPKTFLIDREGNIAAINPRDNLEAALQEVLKKG